MARASTAVTRTSKRKRSLYKYRPRVQRRKGRILRRKRAGTSTRLRLFRSPFPNGKLVSHRYCDVVTLPGATAAGFPSVFVFRANSTYDPDYTGVGHQPLYRDEMAAVYSYYTVMKSFIKVTFPNEEQTKCLHGVFVDDTANAIGGTNLPEIIEKHKYASTTKLDKRNNSLVVRGYFDAARWEKTTPSGFLADNDNKISSTNNPGKGRYFHVWRSPLDIGTQLGTMLVTVEIVYHVMWREPTAPAQS